MTDSHMRTSRDIAQHLQVSRWTVWRAVKSLTGHLDAPQYRRDGSHPRKHRVFTDREADLILKAKLKHSITASFFK